MLLLNALQKPRGIGRGIRKKYKRGTWERLSCCRVFFSISCKIRASGRKREMERKGKPRVLKKKERTGGSHTKAGNRKEAWTKFTEEGEEGSESTESMLLLRTRWGPFNQNGRAVREIREMAKQRQSVFSGRLKTSGGGGKTLFNSLRYFGKKKEPKARRSRGTYASGEEITVVT